MATVNIVGPKFDPPFDRDLFQDDDELQPLLEEDRTMAHLLARVGKFASVGDAKRNGWDIPVPTGWNHFIIGKGAKRWDIFIHNPTHTMQEFIDEFGDD